MGPGQGRDGAAISWGNVYSWLLHESPADPDRSKITRLRKNSSTTRIGSWPRHVMCKLRITTTTYRGDLIAIRGEPRSVMMIKRYYNDTCKGGLCLSKVAQPQSCSHVSLTREEASYVASLKRRIDDNPWCVKSSLSTCRVSTSKGTAIVSPDKSGSRTEETFILFAWIRLSQRN